MSKLWYATTNSGKFASLQRHLSLSDIELVQAPLNIPEPRFDRVDDTAVLKVMHAYEVLRQPVVANDAGFYVHGLNGFPGAFVNFSLATVKIEGLLHLANITDRACKFRHALAYHDGRGAPMVFTDEVPGHMTIGLEGVYDPTYHWSELVRIFMPDGQNKTLGAMDRAEYDYWSEHKRPRPTYAEQFLAWYRQNRT